MAQRKRGWWVLPFMLIGLPLLGLLAFAIAL